MPQHSISSNNCHTYILIVSLSNQTDRKRSFIRCGVLSVLLNKEKKSYNSRYANSKKSYMLLRLVVKLIIYHDYYHYWGEPHIDRDKRYTRVELYLSVTGCVSPPNVPEN